MRHNYYLYFVLLFAQKSYVKLITSFISLININGGNSRRKSTNLIKYNIIKFRLGYYKWKHINHSNKKALETRHLSRFS